MKTDLFQSCGHCWVFQICWHIECSIFTASSFRIWNSSTSISSLLLALFVVTLSKAHLTSHSRMSGSRWVIKPLWLSGSWRSFFYSSSVYSCHLFLISFASVRSISFLSFIVPILAWNVPLVSLVFVKKSLVFPFLLFSSISLHWSLRKEFLISPCYSLELCIQFHSAVYISPRQKESTCLGCWTQPYIWLSMANSLEQNMYGCCLGFQSLWLRILQGTKKKDTEGWGRR